MTFLQRVEELKKAQAIADKLSSDLSGYILEKIPSEVKLVCSIHARGKPLTVSVWEYHRGTFDSARFAHIEGKWVVNARGTFNDSQVESIRLVLEELMLESTNAV